MFLQYWDITIYKFETSISIFIQYRDESISILNDSISNILRYSTGSISNVPTFDIDVFKISSIRCRMSKHSISSVISYPDIEGHFLTLDIDAIS